MRLTRQNIGRMIDLSVVGVDITESKLQILAGMAKRYQCVIATTLPSFTHLLIDLLADAPNVGVSGNVAFPSGSVTTSIKVAETKELVRIGCREIDMVINIGMHLSGRYQYVEDDIKSVVEAADGLAVKAILECYYLTDDQIKKACELCLNAGVAFIKTGTGWTPIGATLESISLIKSCVGDDVAIKASGGIRCLDTLTEMYRRGATRFGIGLGKEEKIFEQCDTLKNHQTATYMSSVRSGQNQRSTENLKNHVILRK